jgi:hypothetical protein
MVNHGFTGNLFCGKICAREGYKGVKLIRFPLFFFSVVDSFDTSAEMTCNPFQTELTSGTRKISCGSFRAGFAYGKTSEHTKAK